MHRIGRGASWHEARQYAVLLPPGLVEQQPCSSWCNQVMTNHEQEAYLQVASVFSLVIWLAATTTHAEASTPRA